MDVAPDAPVGDAVPTIPKQRQESPGVSEGDGGAFAFRNRVAAWQFRQTAFDAACEDPEMQCVQGEWYFAWCLPA